MLSRLSVSDSRTATSPSRADSSRIFRASAAVRRSPTAGDQLQQQAGRAPRSTALRRAAAAAPSRPQSAGSVASPMPASATVIRNMLRRRQDAVPGPWHQPGGVEHAAARKPIRNSGNIRRHGNDGRSPAARRLAVAPSPTQIGMIIRLRVSFTTTAVRARRLAVTGRRRDHRGGVVDRGARPQPERVLRTGRAGARAPERAARRAR